MRALSVLAISGWLLVVVLSYERHDWATRLAKATATANKAVVESIIPAGKPVVFNAPIGNCRGDKIPGKVIVTCN